MGGRGGRGAERRAAIRITAPPRRRRMEAQASVITGSPGTGKHAVASAVSRRLGLRLVDISEAAAGLGLCERGGADGTSDVDAGLLAAGMRDAGMLAGRCLVVGHLAPYVVAAGQVAAMVVLRRSPYELERVYAERGYPAAKAADNLGAEILGIIAHDAARLAGAPRTAQVDTTGRAARETAGIVSDLLVPAADRAAGRGRGGAVDWLAMVAGRGDLGRFFPPGGGG